MVHIITDNAANLPKALREQYGIEELCLTYTVDGVPADTSEEFDGREFYEALRRGASVQTSMVTPDAAQKGMEPYLINGEDVLYVGLSGGVSGTCWGVGLVARELAEQYPERKIRVLDTRGASLGAGCRYAGATGGMSGSFRRGAAGLPQAGKYRTTGTTGDSGG